MGRKSHARSLSVWSNGERVGTWTIPARGDMQFLYDRAWRASPLGRPLSLSLPYTGELPLRGDVVHNYFDNLLPDSEPIRKRLASRYKLASIDAFDLLQEIGRDCVGAVQLLKEDEAPVDVKRIDATPMSEDDVERHLIQLTRPGPPGAVTTTTSCVFRWQARKKRPRCCGTRAVGCDRMARRLPPTSLNCRWDWLATLMGKNKHYRFAAVQRRHFNSTAAKYFMRAEDVIERILARTTIAIEAVAARLPSGFSEQVAATIFAGMARSAKQLAAMAKS